MFWAAATKVSYWIKPSGKSSQRGVTGPASIQPQLVPHSLTQSDLKVLFRMERWSRVTLSEKGRQADSSFLLFYGIANSQRNFKDPAVTQKADSVTMDLHDLYPLDDGPLREASSVNYSNPV